MSDVAETSLPKKRGRHRVCCAECRRLKLKCDRVFPCKNCVDRSCGRICPDGTRERAKRKTGHATSPIRHSASSERNMDVSVTASTTEDERSGLSPIAHNQDPVNLAHQPIGSLQPSSIHASASAINTNYNDFPSVRFDYAIADTPDNIRAPPAASGSAQPGYTFSTEEEEAYGTLVMEERGRSRYLGAAAGSEWLCAQEQNAVSGHNSDEEDGADLMSDYGAQVYSRAALIGRLPHEDEGRALTESYWRFFAWNHSPVPRQTIDRILSTAYTRSPDLHLHDLALLFALLAIGVLRSLEYRPNDPIADDYLRLANACLQKGRFLIHNSLSSVQALTLIAHFHSESEKGRNGDRAWPLWGLSIRLLQGMGVHRDGSRWQLPDDVVEERRLVLWECQTIDVFQSHCFSRPATMRTSHIDTHFPTQASDMGIGTSDLQPATEFKRLKYMLGKLFEATLDQAMLVETPPYDSIINLNAQLTAFEINVPFHLRCRVAMQATPSRYLSSEDAVRQSPPLDRRNFRATFEQCTLALNIAEAILFLHRPYYAKALQINPDNATNTQYGQSFLAVVERCNVVIQIVCTIVEAFPQVASRHWFYWYHLFTAAVCVGTLPLRSPISPLGSFALGLVTQAVSAYSIATTENPSRALIKNMEWLARLRKRVSVRLDAATTFDLGSASRASDNDEDDELCGWRTRLIERGTGVGIRKMTIRARGGLRGGPQCAGSISISPSSLYDSHGLDQSMTQTMPGALDTTAGSVNTGSDITFDNDLDLFLQQYWEPLL